MKKKEFKGWFKNQKELKEYKDRDIIIMLEVREKKLGEAEKLIPIYRREIALMIRELGKRANRLK